jgi:16S rRNA (cytosine967-C5)-methyltransferase
VSGKQSSGSRPVGASRDPQEPSGHQSGRENGPPGGGRGERGSARQAAARAIAHHIERFPDLLPGEPETRGLDERDAALAHAVYDGVVRHWLLLEHLLNRVLARPLRQAEPRLGAILLTGAAQLLLLDRVPAHAAINEAVEQAKGSGRGAAGLVNAVLRKVAGMRRAESRPAPEVRGVADLPRDQAPLSSGAWVSLSGPLLPENPAARLSIATSHPAWLVDRWLERGEQAAVALAIHDQGVAPTVLNTSAASRPLPGSLIPHCLAGHHVFAGGRGELVALVERSDVWVQDAASSRAVAAAAEGLRPGLIIDACAGQGTKTRQLAATFPGAEIIASDVDEERFRTLRRVFEGHPRVRVKAYGSLREGFAGAADLVLLDVPCSNTGVLPRRIEARYRCGPEQLERLTAVQRQIFAEAMPLLRGSPRGRILYSTCSLEPEENQAQALWAAARHGLRVERQGLLLPDGRPGGDPGVYHDGSFFSLLA